MYCSRWLVGPMFLGPLFALSLAAYMSLGLVIVCSVPFAAQSLAARCASFWNVPYRSVECPFQITITYTSSQSLSFRNKGGNWALCGVLRNICGQLRVAQNVHVRTCIDNRQVRLQVLRERERDTSVCSHWLTRREMGGFMWRQPLSRNL